MRAKSLTSSSVWHLLNAVIAGSRCCIALFLGDFVGKLEDRVLFMIEHEVVVLHFDLCHLLRHTVVLIQELLPLRICELLEVLELVGS